MKALLVTVTLLALAACAPGSDASPTPTLTGAPTPRPPDMPSSTPPPISGVPQQILEAIITEAARLSGVATEQIAVVRAEPAVWSDGSLGCPAPGEVYIQVLVDGYWVVLQAAQEMYDFRVDSTGNFKLCPPGRGLPPAGAEDIPTRPGSSPGSNYY